MKLTKNQIIAIVVIAIILLVLFIWKPWQKKDTTTSTGGTGSGRRMYKVGGGITPGPTPPSPSPTPSRPSPINTEIIPSLRELPTCKCPDGTYKALCCDNEKTNELRRVLGNKPLPVTLPPSCIAWIYSQADNPNNAQLFKSCIAEMGRT